MWSSNEGVGELEGYEGCSVTWVGGVIGVKGLDWIGAVLALVPFL